MMTRCQDRLNAPAATRRGRSASNQTAPAPRTGSNTLLGATTAPAGAGGTRAAGGPGPGNSTPRPDLSGSFAVTLIAGLTSAGLFFAAALRQELPLEQVVTHPFGLMALVLLAGAAVMTRVGDV